jgi:signal transduction histidine kinase
LFWQSSAQSPFLTGLKTNIATANSEKKKLDYILDYLQYRNSIHGDTLLVYARLAYNIAARMHDSSGMRYALYYQLAGNLVKGNTDSILSMLEGTTMLSFPRDKDPYLHWRLQLLRANVYNRQNERAKAMDVQLALLGTAEEQRDSLAMAFVLNYLGASCLNLDRTQAAHDYWFRGLAIAKAMNGREAGEAAAYISSNLQLFFGREIEVHPSQAVRDSFMLFTNETIRLSKVHRVYSLLATGLCSRAAYRGYIGQLEASERDFDSAAVIRKSIGDPFSISHDLMTRANLYYNLKQWDKCIQSVESAISIATAAGLKEPGFDALSVLGAAYKAKGDYKSYSESLEKALASFELSVKSNAPEKIAEVETRYEVQKKEALIARQQLQLLKNRIWLGVAVALTAILLPSGWFLFRRYRQKQKVRLAAMLAEEQQARLQQVREAEENERKRIAAELHDSMGVQANAILHNSSMLASADNTSNGMLIHNLQETAKEMLGNLRETVWALRAQEVSVADTWLRILNFVKQVRRNYPQISFEAEGDPPPGDLIAAVRALHLVMVVKETIQNALKHAKPATITIESSFTPGGWQFVVADDGIGFDPGSPGNADGNGLRNIRNRSAAGHFTVDITSVRGKGTKTSIHLPIKVAGQDLPVA